MNKMVTAVEWLQEQIDNELKVIDNLYGKEIMGRKIGLAFVKRILVQAKAMERDLIKESCTMAIMQWHEWDKTNYLDKYDHKIEGAEIWAEDYVKELYGEIEVPKPNQNK